jgi:hypothetical protein
MLVLTGARIAEATHCFAYGIGIIPILANEVSAVNPT